MLGTMSLEAVLAAIARAPLGAPSSPEEKAALAGCDFAHPNGVPFTLSDALAGAEDAPEPSSVPAAE